MLRGGHEHAVLVVRLDLRASVFANVTVSPTLT
jgi:hypothetical protein